MSFREPILGEDLDQGFLCGVYENSVNFIQKSANDQSTGSRNFSKE